MILGRFGGVHAFASIGRVTEFASVGIIREESIPIPVFRSRSSDPSIDLCPINSQEPRDEQ
jgi:hypothetical protein